MMARQQPSVLLARIALPKAFERSYAQGILSPSLVLCRSLTVGLLLGSLAQLAKQLNPAQLASFALEGAVIATSALPTHSA